MIKHQIDFIIVLLNFKNKHFEHFATYLFALYLLLAVLTFLLISHFQDLSLQWMESMYSHP